MASPRDDKADNPMKGHGPGSARMVTVEPPKHAGKTVLRLLHYLRPFGFRILFSMTASMLVAGATIYTMRLMGVAIDRYILQYNPQGLLRVCLTMAIIYACTSALTYASMRIMTFVAQKISVDIRTDLYDAYLGLPMSFFDEHSNGDLMSRLTNDVNNVDQTLSGGLTQLLEGLFNFIGMLVAMLLLSPFLTGWAMLVIPMTIVSTKTVVYFSRRFFAKLQKDLGEMNGFIEETLSAQKMLLLHDQKDTGLQRFNALNETLNTSYHRAQTLSALGPVMGFINNAVYLLVTVIGASMILRGDGSMSVGVLFTFLMYMRRFANPLNEIASLFNTIQSAIAGAERIFEVIDAKPEADEQASPFRYASGDVRYDHVDFSYNTDVAVLKDITFGIPPGTDIALVGATGSGKTTIAGLINRFYDPTHGTITIDEQRTVDLAHGPLRKHIALVLQDTFLFTDTIRENIRYGAATATDESVMQAAKLSGADRFIMQLEHGYDTVLRENGSNLSHGQRQLIAIARAILADAPILILDEATSSIDTRTEAQVQQSLRTLMQGKTTLIIAHRLSTIRNAAHILVIDQGRIVEQGNHDKLMQQKNIYYRMYMSQMTSI